jgi:hypothetical protein
MQLIAQSESTSSKINSHVQQLLLQLQEKDEANGKITIELM